MEGVKVCAFRRNSIVAPSPLTLLLCQMEQRMTTGKKIKNKDGNFFQRGSIADMPHKSGHCFRGGKDPLGGLFVSLKKNLAKCKRKYPESVAGTPKAFQLLRNILNELLSLCRRQ